ncbi:alpha/beta hydrolase [Burkholderia pseudomultivorans]|uniref:alpha/beta hydrolase n=1 Tax=Burkholderia pseudomultivorans TaxID=1207504 RepID=UPI00075B41A3|nr:alpha/beta hydrolase [Burkholderia pseudomultivorans]KWI60658.1 arylesterase [Burkholderia pseudomultivorans]MBF5008178.1 alpha/beta hydrolase [Burkholderia pseudomultivorans]
MDTLHLVDSDIRPWLDVWPTVTLTADNLAQLRVRELPLPPPDPTGNTLEHRLVPGPEGAPDIPVLLYRPDDAPRPLPAIVHLHGGGYVRGAAKDLEALHRPLVKALGCALISVDYRLAPETPFPGAIEDAYAALAWTFRHADALGIDSSRIGVAGESAGGGLAAALALIARDRGEYALAFQHLMYPMLDDRTCTRTPHPHAGEFVWTAASNRFGWTALLGHAPGADGVSPYAAAARAERLDGLPPTFIAVGALDLFVDENVDYARRLVRAGVPTELHVFPGAVHGFDVVPDARLSASARRLSHDALRRFLHG